ncbi:MAG: M60 family metallopeptidase [Planctomycetota bacterium]|nr:M60 family metallopeptidase [Planctomycetota bacterium]
MRLRTTALLLLLLLAAPDVRGAPDGDAQQALLEGVTTIAVPGVPGPLCLVSPEAQAIVTAGDDREPVVGVASFGRGRIVAFGHGGYFSKGTLAVADTTRLLQNAVVWARGRRNGDVLVVRAAGLAAALDTEAVTVRQAADLASNAKDLRGVAVLCVDVGRIRGDAARKAVRRFVKQGGGLVTASLGWGWLQLNPGKDLATEHPGNTLLAEAGVLWGDGTLRASNKRYAADGKRLALANASDALTLLEAQAVGEAQASKAALRQASAVVLRAAATLPENDKLLMPRLVRLLRDKRGAIVPTAATPLPVTRALDRVLLGLEVRRIEAIPAREVKAHPAAAAFPGDVPKGARTERRTVVLETSRAGHPREGIYAAAGKPVWHSTGLYAAPGARIRVTVPGAHVEDGLGVRIGSHTDKTWHKPSWSRAPSISRWFPIQETSTTAANAFGGLIYITAPKALRAGDIEVGVEGGVPAPRFVLGETTPQAWRETIRAYPGPWAELETKKVILTLPAANVRTLDDPEPVLRFWDRIQDACADLAARPRERHAPERVCADVQISNGYMHSGYPFMTHLDAAGWMADKAKLAKGSWGLFHEMGHNHQSRHWTFDGTTEVTVNLFSLYILDQVCGIPPDKGRKNVPVSAKKLAAYRASGPDFQQWKRDPWLALTTYWQLQQAFGWQSFIDVFAAYRTLPKHELPKTDQDKRDQFLVRYSKRVGKNLGPFFEAWGIPTTEAARAAVASLPPWMPEAMRGE